MGGGLESIEGRVGGEYGNRGQGDEKELSLWVTI